MTPYQRRLVNFVVARIQENVALAESAISGYSVEVTSHMSSEVHSNFVRRFDPKWVLDDCYRKLHLVEFEVLQQQYLDDNNLDERYHFAGTKVLASTWGEHPDYSDAFPLRERPRRVDDGVATDRTSKDQ